jgi:hypothetical protein
MFQKLFIAAVALTLLLGGLCTLWWPMGRDQGTFAYTADVILHGGIPYKDAWEQKGPACHYTVAAAILLFGHNEWGIRVLDLLFVAAGMAALAALCRRIEGRLAAAIAVALYLLWYWGGGYWHTAQPDAWIAAIQLIVMGMLIGTEAPVQAPGVADGGSAVGAALSPRWVFPPKALRLAGAGFLIGVAALYKPPFGICILALLPAALDRAQPVRRRIILLLCAVIGCEIPLVITASWFKHHAALDDLIALQFSFNLFGYKSAHRDSPFAVVEGIHGFWRSIEPVFTAPAALVGARQLWQRRRTGAWIVLIFLLIDVTLVVVQNRYFAYHWVPVLGPLALLCGIGVSRVKSMLDRAEKSLPAIPPSKFPRLAASAILIVTLAMASAHLGGKVAPWLDSVVQRRTWSSYYASFPSVTVQQKIADEIDRHSKPDDALLVWGFDPLINYLADRRAPTRFAMHYGLTRDPPHAMQEAWRAEFMDDLRRRPPLYIVVADQDAEPLMPRTSKQYMEQFPQFRQFVNENYQVEQTIGNYTIWRRREPKQAKEISK